jgi:hypothetical protein
MPLVYSTDKDPRTPGLLTNVYGRPTLNGYASLDPRNEFFGASGSTAVWDYTKGGHGQTLYGMVQTDGLGRLFSGYTGSGAGNSKLYQFRTVAGLSAVTDVSVAGGYTCTTAPTVVDEYQNTWAFANWGNIVFACNRSETLRGLMQYQATSASAFADIATSPLAGSVVVFKDFVIAGNIGNTFGGGIVGTNDMIAWSDQGNYTVWTPASGVQANWARTRDSDGDIVALKRLGDSVIVYKRNAIYRMTYIGPPYTFKLEKVVDGIGVLVGSGYPPCVVDIGNAHIFIGDSDVYLFDGTRPVPIGYGNVLNDLVVQTQGMIHNIDQGAVTFMTTGHIYNYKLNKWGKDYTYAAKGAGGVPFGVSVNSTLHYITILASLADYHVPVSRLWCGNASENKSAICAHNPNGTDEALVLTTGLWGKPDQHTLLKRVTPMMGFVGETASYACSVDKFAYPFLSTTAASGVSTTYDSTRNRFDVLSESLYHRATVTITPTDSPSRIEVIDIVPTLEAKGRD